jgi:1,4-dihydroxy-2-naphthoate octaprenyltransferase
MNKRANIISPLIKISRPGLLLSALLTYLLGLGIGHHLAAAIQPGIAILGFVMVICLLEMRQFLEAFYRHPLAPENVLHHSAKVDDPFLSAVGAFQRPFLFYVGIGFLGLGAVMTTLLAIQGQFSPLVYILLGVALLLCYFSEVPPLELSEKGYDEVIESLLVAFLIPAISLSMQTGELHLLLVLFCVPLAFLYLAMRIVRGLENYGKDSLTGRQTMLVRMGWQRGMNLHHLSLIGAYLMVGVSAVLQLPWSLTWPMLLSLPIAVLQILQVQQIAAGAKPNWRLLDLTAIASFGITAYMIALTLWIR